MIVIENSPMLQFDTTPTQSLASVIFGNSQMTGNREFQTVGLIYSGLWTLANKMNSTNIKKVIKRCHTVEPRYNEPLYNEVIGTANDFFV